MTSTPTACQCDHGAKGFVCASCQTFLKQVTKPRQPSLTSSAVKTLDRLLDMPADELKAKIDAHAETGLGELVVNATHPKPRQPDMSAERDAAAEAYSDRVPSDEAGMFEGDEVSKAFCAGADWGHAQAAAQIGDRLAELHRRIDRYIKENCALYEQLAASEKRADAYEKALELIERAYATHGERMAHQDCAAKVLSQHKRPTKESVE